MQIEQAKPKGHVGMSERVPTGESLMSALRIGGQVTYERIVRAKATRIEDVPGSPHAITPQWLTAALCKNHPSAEVTDFVVKSVSAGTHERHRLTIAYNEAGLQAGLPRTVFTKSSPTIVTRMICGYAARFEGRFYMQIRPMLDIEAPRAYHAATDRKTLATILLLEDLSATKAVTFCNNKSDVTREMAEQMIDLLATLHARFYGDPELPNRFAWLNSYPRWFAGITRQMSIERYTLKSFDAAAHVIPASLQAQRHEIMSAAMRNLELHIGQPQSVLHGDLHIGNWYRTGAGEMGLYDWQCVARGHWSKDFAYVVTAALTPDNRRAWERDLLRRYLDRFAELSGVKLDFDQSFLWYRQQIIFALLLWTPTLTHSPFFPNMQPKTMSLTMIERMSTAMADLDSLRC
jgi:aminoglycoside phosphotransferase (APT) family kinase protein